MTFLERVEAACNEFHGDDFVQGGSDYRESRMNEMARALQAAYPELHTSPPEAWIAPWETTREMDESVEGDREVWDYSFFRDWEDARDAHLSASQKDGD